MPPVFTIGWVCALPVELAAARVVMDEEYDPFPTPPTDTNIYAFGRIGIHNVVAACSPAGQMGTNSAAVVASQIRNSFPSLRISILVGLGGGVPSNDNDIRLGDVVISQPAAQHGGVVQFDFGKTVSGGDFTRTGSLNAPPAILLNALAKLRANEYHVKLHVMEHLSAFVKLKKFPYPGPDQDVLHSASSQHVMGPTCASCSAEDIVVRQTRDRKDPNLLFGTIASGNQVLKDAPTRDRISRDLGGVLCFEMEAAGLMNNFECLVVRGICDYADAHKNKQWQPYAAATAAAYAKELLLHVPQGVPATESNQTAHHTSEILSIISPLSVEDQYCLRSLAFPEQESRGQEIHFEQSTGKWLLEDYQYQKWTKKANGLFWVKGKPGTGKSALMKSAAAAMRHEQSISLVLSYFIHGRGTDLQRSPFGVLRALLNALLASFPQELSQLTEIFEDHEARYGSKQAMSRSWAAQELRDCMLETLRKETKDKPVVIFVDGLDECGEDDAKALLSYFIDLMQTIEMERGNVKICFSSRPWQVFNSDTIPNIYVEEQNGGDIQLVVHERLKQIATGDMRRQIEEQILLKSQGVFLWAVLVTNMILDGDATGMEEADLLEMLSTFPETLDGLYEAILSSSTGAEKRQMVKLFQWILFARRPLSSQELREALEPDEDTASATQDLVWSHGSWVGNFNEFEIFENYIKHLSRGLVEFQNHDIWEQYEPDEEIWSRQARFIHRSVADYLCESFLPHHETARSVLGAGHLEISKSCFRSITLSDVQVGTSMIHGPLVPRSPLVTYAIHFLVYHIEKVIQEGISEVDLWSSLQWDHQSTNLGLLDRLWKLIKPDRAHEPPSDVAYLFGALSGPRKYGKATQAQLIGAAEANSEMSLHYPGFGVPTALKNHHRPIADNAPDHDLLTEYWHKAVAQLDNDDDDLVAALADDLYSDILGLIRVDKASIGALKDDEIWDQAFASLPELLRDFALSIEYSAKDQTQRDTMMFIYENRDRITQKLWESYICDSRSSSLNETSAISKSGETGDKNDKILDWLDGNPGANKPELSAEPLDYRTPPPDPETGEKIGMSPRDLHDFHGSDVNAASGEGSQSSETKVGGRVDIFRKHIHDLEAYKWLQSRLRRGFLMTPAEPDILTEIRQQIMDQLPPLRRIRRRMSSSTYHVTFRVEWNPHSFLGQQGYLGEPDDAISNALTLTGTTSDAQAMSCAEYLHSTWPLTGEVLLKLILEIVKDEAGVEHTAELFDHTKLSAHTEVSQLVVTASGTRALLAELGQQLAWLGSALPIRQEQTDQAASTYCRPYLFPWEENRRSASRSAFHPVWDIRFRMRKKDDRSENPNGQCWTRLIRNRVLVQGYPIFRRPEPGTGLEVALHVISWLLDAPYVTVFDGRPFIKGTRMMLVLTKRSENGLIWHLLESDKESRIAYIDPKVPRMSPEEARTSDLKDIELSRHFVGWCSRSISSVGAPDANYDIQASDLTSRTDCPFSLQGIQPGVPISSRSGPSDPQNESAINAPIQRQQGYFKRLQYLASESVALFDSKDKRSWLVDGVSALLHLVRLALESERTDSLSGAWYEFEMEEYEDSRRPSTNHSFAILNNENNHEKRLFTHESGNPETFKQRVEKILSFLDLVIDTEKSLNGQGHACLFLEGYEFKDVAAATPNQRIPRHSMTQLPEGDASINLCRELSAVTLIGEGFGELIKPEPSEMDGLCKSWKLVPKEKGYICVQTSHLEYLMLKRLDQRSRLWSYVKNLLRNKSDLVCAKHCERNERGTCNHAQTLQISGQYDGLKDSAAYKTSDDSTLNSAIIFGRCSRSSDRKTDLCNKDESRRSDVFSNTTLAQEGSLATLFTSPQYTSLPSPSERPTQDSLGDTRSRNTAMSNIRKTAPDEDKQETNQPQNRGDKTSTLDRNQESNPFNFILYVAVAMGCFMVENFYWTTISLSFMIFIFFYHKWKPTRAWVRIIKYLCVATLLVWLIVLSPLHVLLPTLLDLWTPYQATFDSAPYEIIYDRGDFSFGDISVDVFAIHGLGSNASRAWVSRDGSNIHWLRDILPRHNKLKNIRVILLNHHTFWASHSPTMTFHDHARSMLHHIRDVNQGENPIIFVAHSFGGLLLKQALLYAQSQGHDVALRTKGILFLGVPHHGASNTLIARLLACTAYWRGSSDAILKLLSTHKRDLQELDNAFRDSFTHSGRHDNTIRPHITNFLEMRPEKLGAFSLKETVDREYGELGYARNIFLDTDHRGLNKFRSSDDANFRTFLSQFLAAFEHETKGLGEDH